MSATAAPSRLSKEMTSSPKNSGLRHKGWNQNRKWPRPGNIGSNGVIEAASAPVLRGNLSPRQHVFPLSQVAVLVSATRGEAL